MGSEMGYIYLKAICLDVKDEKRREGHRCTWGTLWLSEDFVSKEHHSKRLYGGETLYGTARCVHHYLPLHISYRMG